MLYPWRFGNLSRNLSDSPVTSPGAERVYLRTEIIRIGRRTCFLHLISLRSRVKTMFPLDLQVNLILIKYSDQIFWSNILIKYFVNRKISDKNLINFSDVKFIFKPLFLITHIFVSRYWDYSSPPTRSTEICRWVWPCSFSEGIPASNLVFSCILL